ncbi:glycoside hydrolase family 97 catalytic domain-containing protein [Luteolibacter algae]|uniref:Glycoside hydrolase family 97 catalytic domain-containing protein n=1 Tax=Luteolibacter algae TaxID=454151 RepID=A0ABW5D7A1_9BACT
MMNNSLKYSLLAIAAITCGHGAWAQEILGKSPDGKVSAAIFVDEANSLRYRVDFKNSTVVEPSALGITVEGIKLGEGVALGSPETSVIDEKYETRGNHRQARNHYTQLIFPVTHKETGREYTLELRLYDDGAAYRYIVPGEGKQHVDGESSSWTIMKDSKVWYFERLAPGWKLKSYAGEWMSTDIGKLDSATPASVGPIQGVPLVMELPEKLGYALITKAALYNYSGMRLKAVGDRTVVANFTEGDKGFDVEGDIVTPWRATLLADDLNELVNSDFINNLNPAPDPKLFADTSYIKPGRGVWSWETLGLGTPETQRDFIDLAAELEYEYSLVDDGWKEWDSPWETIKELATHARTKNVGVWVWVHSKDIRDPANDWQQMKTYFDRTVEAGVVGIKTDFMDGETKELIDFEIAALRLAAERKLMINFHGCHASTGEERTYPNEMTREGIRGMELNKLKEGPLPAAHNAALPFTRFAVGHADYTPILYTNPGPTTWAHQLATLVTYVSPLQIVAEHPETMMEHPILKNALSVMKDVPTLWDETLVLPGSSIGGLSVFARRSGDTWFVGVLNGAGKRRYQLDLAFLPDGEYEATLVEDDLSAEPVDVAKVGVNTKAKLRQWTTTIPFKVSNRKVNRTQSVDVELATGGGFVARIVKQ